MKTLRSISALLIVLAAGSFTALTAHADTITLTDGTVLEGTIQEETDATVKIEVQVTPTIRDTKVIPRTAIVEMSKLTEEDIAFQEVEAVIPTPPLLSASDYEVLIRSRAQRFLSTYPDSPRKAEVEKILATLEEEKEKASGGSLKIGDEWVPAGVLRSDRPYYDARILHYQMKRRAAAGDYVGAMRDFDKLEKEYQGTESYAAAVEDALKLLPSYAAIVNSSLRDYSFRMEERKKQLMLLPEHQRAKNEEIFKKEMEARKMAADADRKKGLRWVAYNSNSEESLKAAAKLVTDETKRLQTIDTEKQLKAAKLLGEAKAMLEKRNAVGARNRLNDADALLGQSLYLASVQTRVEKLAKELAAEAEAAKKTESQKALDTMKSYGAEAESVSTANPLKQMMDRKKAALAKEEEEKAKPKPKEEPKKPAATTAAAKPKPRPSGGGGGGISFQTIMISLTVVLVLVTVGALVIQKKKGA